jgi:hemerythrin
MQKRRVTNGVYWVDMPEADLFVLCGCPADIVKHLTKAGLIVNREKNGMTAQTGPNAILLSDTTIQKSSFSNLAEFPVLQMLYLQGMIIPDHPNNTGRRPMLIGLEDQVRTQSNYIYRGTYGLASLSEIMESGVPEALAREMLRIKKWFAFDTIRRTEELLDLRIMDTPAVELRDGVFVRRRGFNRYEFIHGGASVAVDLNLGASEQYLPTYQLARQDVRREEFSIVHTGEGDGWDVTRPCMGSMLCVQGRLYLVDAGPGIQHTMAALGVSINEIAGIFHTHAHDDHFAGLTSLVRTDHRIPYYAAAPVKASVVKKYAALTGRNEATFYQYFEPHDLALDAWTALEGFEVLPVFSAHPVETTVFFFRAGAEGAFRTYAHLADLSAFEVLKRMTTDDSSKNGISRAFYEAFTRKVRQPVNVKKVDIGGGLIHGKAEDFIGDTSGKIFLSHTSAPLTEAQKKIGSCAAFGQQEILAQSGGDYLQMNGQRWLSSYFPDASADGIARLMKHPRVSFSPSDLIMPADAPVRDIYFILSGMVELHDSRTEADAMMSAGGLIGELEGFSGSRSLQSCRALSNVVLVRIPCAAWAEFLTGAGAADIQRRLRANRQFLHGTWLFGEMVSVPVQTRIAGVMEKRAMKEGDVLAPRRGAELILLAEGLVTVFLGAHSIENLKPGGFFGEEAMMRGARELPEGWQQRFSRPPRPGQEEGYHLFEARAMVDSVTYAIPAEAIEDIPVVQWKLMETYERRLKSFRAELTFEWHDSYAVGIPDIDEQHRVLFELIQGLAAVADGRAPAAGVTEAVESLVSLARTHVRYEESLSAAHPAQGYDAVRREHAEFLKKAEGFRTFVEEGPADALQTVVEFMKDWVVDHALLENRRFRSFLQS